jgi:hypothetical protein
LATQDKNAQFSSGNQKFKLTPHSHLDELDETIKNKRIHETSVVKGMGKYNK